jgi:solute carrier family 25 phosphate transporter 23/24/25/41
MAFNTNEKFGLKNNESDYVRKNREDALFEYAEKTTGISHDLNDIDMYVVDMYEKIEDEKSQDLNNKKKLNNIKNYHHLIAGAISGFCSRTLTAPLERLKILYQVNYRGKSLQPPNIYQGIKDIYAKDGFTGLFRGNLINLLKSTPDLAIKLYIFEICKSHFRSQKGEEPSNMDLFVSGAIAGITANFTIFPLDVIKTKISATSSGTYKGIIDAFNKLYREGGIKIFYKGVEASICCAIPNTGLQLCFYDVLKKSLAIKGKNNDKHSKEVSSIVYAFFGGLSALLSSTLLYPFQTVQSRIIMSEPFNFKEIKCTFRCSYPYKYPEIEFKPNMLTVINSTFKNEGVRGFFKGYVPGISKVVLGNSISFGLYENIKKIINI